MKGHPVSTYSRHPSPTPLRLDHSSSTLIHKATHLHSYCVCVQHQGGGEDVMEPGGGKWVSMLLMRNQGSDIKPGRCGCVCNYEGLESRSAWYFD